MRGLSGVTTSSYEASLQQRGERQLGGGLVDLAFGVARGSDEGAHAPTRIGRNDRR